VVIALNYTLNLRRALSIYIFTRSRFLVFFSRARRDVFLYFFCILGEGFSGVEKYVVGLRYNFAKKKNSELTGRPRGYFMTSSDSETLL